MFLWRRAIDPVLLSIAIACIPVKLGLDILILGLILCGGIFLIILRHRSMRLIDPYYALAALAYSLVALAIGLYHGEFAADIRWITLSLYFALGIPLFTGFALIRDPLRQMAIGARVGLIVTLVVAIFEGLNGQVRIGLGGNAANAAFVICMMAVMARFQASEAPRYLPNSRLWFYLALVPELMTGTRSVLPIFVFAALIDVVELREVILVKVREAGARRLIGFSLAGLVALSAVAYQTSDIVMERAVYTAKEVDSLVLPADKDVTGIGIRITLWKGAIKIFQEHPLLGLGGEESMRQIKQGIPEAQRGIYALYSHVHFFVLDELRTRGLVGLVFLIGLFAVAFTRIFGIKDHDIRVNALIFLGFLLFYGSLHGLLLGDRNVAVTILLLTALLARRRKDEIGCRAALRK
ncbi:O-antigen ligase family protein [Mesorhizobium sp. A556]